MLAILWPKICYRKYQSTEDSATEVRFSGAGTTCTVAQNKVAEARQPTGKIELQTRTPSYVRDSSHHIGPTTADPEGGRASEREELGCACNRH
jgi:type II secretory pathway pseudopilin PulG